jgi:hypothetical protein
MREVPERRHKLWLGREDSNLRIGESKSARTLSNISAHSESGAEFDPQWINRLAGTSEWTTTKPGNGRATITKPDMDRCFVGYRSVVGSINHSADAVGGSKRERAAAFPHTTQVCNISSDANRKACAFFDHHARLVCRKHRPRRDFPFVAKTSLLLFLIVINSLPEFPGRNNGWHGPC